MIQGYIATLFSILMAVFALIGLYCVFFSKVSPPRLRLFWGSVAMAFASVFIAWLGGI